MKMIFGMLAAMMIVGGVALAEGQHDEPPGGQCVSGGATESNPGAWFKALEKDVWQFEGENPAEIAETEDALWNETANPSLPDEWLPVVP